MFLLFSSLSQTVKMPFITIIFSVKDTFSFCDVFSSLPSFQPFSRQTNEKKNNIKVTANFLVFYQKTCKMSPSSVAVHNVHIVRNFFMLLLFALKLQWKIKLTHCAQITKFLFKSVYTRDLV